MALVPALILWGLYHHFLLRRRLFGTHFGYVRVLERDEVDASMGVGKSC